MDFLDPAKKRALRHRLIAGYCLIGIAILLVTLILVFQSYGYDLDRKTGSIIQNGLLFVSSKPVPADIYLNGNKIKSNSDARLVLPSDIYKLELKRDGYRTWQRTVSLAGATIDRVVYPFLFPTKLDTVDQQRYTAVPAFATQSPDRRWVVIQKPDQPTSFDVFDTSDVKLAPKSFSLPASLLADSPKHHLTLVEWSTDNRHLLVKDTYKGGNEFVMVDRIAPEQSYNVNRVFKVSPTQVALHDKKFDQLYVYDQVKKTLSTGNQKTAKLSPILNNVLAFKSYGSDLIMYATTDQADPSLARLMYKDGSGSYLLRTSPLGSAYLLDLAKYDGHWYVAAGSSPDGRVYVYKDPQGIIKHPGSAPLYPTVVLRVAGANWLEFSANARFMALENGSNFSVYDAEQQHSYSYKIPQKLDTGELHAIWMDDARLLITSQAKTVSTDFDGGNQQVLTANIAGLPALFDRNYETLFNVAPSISQPGQFALTRTDLLIKK